MEQLMIRPSLLSLALVAAFAMAQAKTYEFDTAHSTVGFSVAHMTVSEVPGSFKEYNATFVWDDKAPSASKMEFIGKVASIDTANAKRDEHLRAPDFFDAGKTPEVKFTAKKIAAATGNDFTVSGDLTMKGIAKPVTFTLTVTPEVQHPMNKNMVRGLKTSFVVKRKDFALGEKMPGLMIGEDVTIKVSAEVFRKP
jgi:polyisoprenoid-binding protein YceI